MLRLERHIDFAARLVEADSLGVAVAPEPVFLYVQWADNPSALVIVVVADERALPPPSLAVRDDESTTVHRKRMAMAICQLSMGRRIRVHGRPRVVIEPEYPELTGSDDDVSLREQ